VKTYAYADIKTKEEQNKTHIPKHATCMGVCHGWVQLTRILRYDPSFVLGALIPQTFPKDAEWRRRGHANPTPKISQLRISSHGYPTRWLLYPRLAAHFPRHILIKTSTTASSHVMRQVATNPYYVMTEHFTYSTYFNTPR